MIDVLHEFDFDWNLIMSVVIFPLVERTFEMRNEQSEGYLFVKLIFCFSRENSIEDWAAH